MKARRGFTLLEVLIALVVVALALLALTRTAGGQVSSFEALRERTLAGWVAANVLDELRLATPNPASGRRDGRTRFADRDWRWTVDVQDTGNAQVRRIEVAVFAGDAKQAMATLTGFGGGQP